MERIFKGLEYRVVQPGKITEYRGMEYDSRKVEEGYIFAALTGATVDGHDYIEKAIEMGAKLIIASREVEVPEEVGLVIVEDLRQHLGVIASNFYNWPQKQLKVVGVTGTNGKTTTTYILEKLIGEERIARIGTVEYKVGKRVIPAPNTTPESLDLIKICREAVEKGIEYLIMEVSSHALEMGRVEMIEFDVAAFTNLTLDHLDFHKTVEGYFEAKRKLFLKLKDRSRGVYNVEDEYGRKLYEEFGGVGFGEREGDLRGETLNFTSSSQEIFITYENKRYDVESKLLGRFNMMNILGALGICIQLGMDLGEVVERIEEIEGVPGRFEAIDCGQDFSVIVDYAHTGDGLKNILGALTELKHGRIITIFGCGGNKGRDKRFGMGAASKALSDYTILSSDNPRTEPLESIMGDIETAFTDSEGRLETEKYEKIADRGEAIKRAISMAEKGDIILIAGKGHETTQTVGKDTFKFDDRDEARRYLRELMGIESQ